MKNMLSFTGQDAIDVALASNKQLEAFDGKAWRPILMWKAAAIASRTPENLRLRGPARTMAEAVLGRSLPRSGALADMVRDMHAGMKEPTKSQTVRATALILNSLEDDGA